MAIKEIVDSTGRVPDLSNINYFIIPKMIYMHQVLNMSLVEGHLLFNTPEQVIEEEKRMLKYCEEDQNELITEETKKEMIKSHQYNIDNPADFLPEKILIHIGNLTNEDNIIRWKLLIRDNKNITQDIYEKLLEIGWRWSRRKSEFYFGKSIDDIQKNKFSDIDDIISATLSNNYYGTTSSQQSGVETFPSENVFGIQSNNIILREAFIIT